MIYHTMSDCIAGYNKACSITRYGETQLSVDYIKIELTIQHFRRKMITGYDKIRLIAGNGKMEPITGIDKITINLRMEKT